MKIKVLRFESKNIELIDNAAVIPHENKEATINTLVHEIIEEYNRYDSSICDILGSLCINNLSIEDVVTIYAIVYNIIENDSVIRKYDEGGYVDLVTGDVHHE